MNAYTYKCVYSTYVAYNTDTLAHADASNILYAYNLCSACIRAGSNNNRINIILTHTHTQAPHQAFCARPRARASSLLQTIYIFASQKFGAVVNFNFTYTAYV